jgi:RHS repeat-associated protein
VYDFCRRPRSSTYHHDNDAGTDLDYAMARYYASRSGRFMTPDPGHVGANIGDPQSWNAYTYGANDPINHIDPNGMTRVPIREESECWSSLGGSVENVYFGLEHYKRSETQQQEGGTIIVNVEEGWEEKWELYCNYNDAGALDFPRAFINEVNPLNSSGSVGQTLLSMWDSAAGLITGNWARTANAWDYGPLGQTANTTGVPYYGTRIAFAGATVAGVAAGGIVIAEAAGMPSIQLRVALHGPHHTFVGIGQQPHIQVNAWLQGVKGSGRTLLRIPTRVPDAW